MSASLLKAKCDVHEDLLLQVMSRSEEFHVGILWDDPGIIFDEQSRDLRHEWS